MRSNLKDIFKIQRVLEEVGYFDISRVSQEIYDHCQKEDVPIDNVLERVLQNEPWEYIRGYTEFCNHRFNVNKNVLIPRVETEQLVEIALSIIDKERISKVVDIGTGSGCIIISIALACQNRKDIKYYGIDISKEAISIAKQNARENKSPEIYFKHSNLIDEIGVNDTTLLVANLPYIPSDIYSNLHESVKNYEPKLALEAGKDGLKYYTPLIDEIRERKSKPILLLEIDPSITKKLREYLNEDTLLIKDYRGFERFLLIRF